MPDIPIIILLVIGGLFVGAIGLGVLINVGRWFAARADEKLRSEQRRERHRERMREREIMRMQRSGSEVWMNTSRDPRIGPDTNDGEPSGEDWVRYYALRDEHLLQAAAEDAQRAEETYVNHILERKKIEAVKKVADESIVRVIDLK